MNFKKLDKFLLILLGIDCIFILLSFIDMFSDISLDNFLVQSDGLFAEKFQYLRFIAINIHNKFSDSNKKKGSSIFNFYDYSNISLLG